MRVLLFAGLKESCGGATLEVEAVPPLTVAELRAAAEKACPALSGRRFRVAVDSTYARDDDPIPEGAEVAFLPPVSGG